VPHVHVSRISGDPLRLRDAMSYLASEVRPAVERQHGSLGTALLISPEGGVARFESFWAPGGPLARDEAADEPSVSEAARRAGGTVATEDYEVLVFEREEPLDAGCWVRMTPIDAGPSRRAEIEDAVAWYGDTAVPQLVDTSGFCAALLYADWASGRMLSQTVWRDQHVLATSSGTAAAVEAAVAEAIEAVIGATEELLLEFSSAEPA
jgi:hypothetical protein